MSGPWHWAARRRQMKRACSSTSKGEFRFKGSPQARRGAILDARRGRREPRRAAGGPAAIWRPGFLNARRGWRRRRRSMINFSLAGRVCTLPTPASTPPMTWRAPISRCSKPSRLLWDAISTPDWRCSLSGSAPMARTAPGTAGRRVCLDHTLPYRAGPGHVRERARAPPAFALGSARWGRAARQKPLCGSAVSGMPIAGREIATFWRASTGRPSKVSSVTPSETSTRMATAIPRARAWWSEKTWARRNWTAPHMRGRPCAPFARWPKCSTTATRLPAPRKRPTASLHASSRIGGAPETVSTPCR